MIVPAHRPAWPSDVDGLGRMVENPVDGLGLPGRPRPLRECGAEWVILVGSVEDIFEDAGEDPAVDILLRQAFRLFVDGLCHGLVLLAFDDVLFLCLAHVDAGILNAVECVHQLQAELLLLLGIVVED